MADNKKGQKWLRSLQAFHKDRKFVVQHLPANISEQDMLDIFTFLPVQNVCITGCEAFNGLTATIIISHPEMYDPLIRSESLPTYVKGHTINVKLSNTVNLLCVTNLPPNCSEEQFKFLVEKFGPVKRCFLVYDHETDLSKGYGMVEYCSQAVACQARSLLHCNVVDGCLLHCEWLNEQQVTYASLYSRLLYVDQLPLECKDHYALREFFSAVERPIYCQLAVENGRMLGFGLVEYTDAKDAHKSLEYCKNSTFYSSPIRISYAVPGVGAMKLYSRLLQAAQSKVLYSGGHLSSSQSIKETSTYHDSTRHSVHPITPSNQLHPITKQNLALNPVGLFHQVYTGAVGSLMQRNRQLQVQHQIWLPQFQGLVASAKQNLQVPNNIMQPKRILQNFSYDRLSRKKSGGSTTYQQQIKSKFASKVKNPKPEKHKDNYNRNLNHQQSKKKHGYQEIGSLTGFRKQVKSPGKSEKVSPKKYTQGGSLKCEKSRIMHNYPENVSSTSPWQKIKSEKSKITDPEKDDNDHIRTSEVNKIMEEGKDKNLVDCVEFSHNSQSLFSRTPRRPDISQANCISEWLTEQSPCSLVPTAKTAYVPNSGKMFEDWLDCNLHKHINQFDHERSPLRDMCGNNLTNTHKSDSFKSIGNHNIPANLKTPRSVSDFRIENWNSMSSSAVLNPNKIWQKYNNDSYDVYSVSAYRNKLSETSRNTESVASPNLGGYGEPRETSIIHSEFGDGILDPNSIWRASNSSSMQNIGWHMPLDKFRSSKSNYSSRGAIACQSARQSESLASSSEFHSPLPSGLDLSAFLREEIYYAGGEEKQETQVIADNENCGYLLPTPELSSSNSYCSQNCQEVAGHKKFSTRISPTPQKRKNPFLLTFPEPKKQVPFPQSERHFYLLPCLTSSPSNISLDQCPQKTQKHSEESNNNITPLQNQKRRYLLPSPEPSPPNGYIGQHSQGIGGHYAEPRRKRSMMGSSR